MQDFKKRGKETVSLPIIILSAKGEEEDKVRGLNTGADDYITKPFSPTELIARIKSLLRRSTSSGKEVIEFGDITLNLDEHKVFRSGKRIHLGPTEYKLLRHFIENQKSLFKRTALGLCLGTWNLC